MPKEERNKGQRIFGKASAVGQQSSAPPQPPQQQNAQAAASVIPGLSYSSAASSMEAVYNAYRRQGN